MRFPKRPQKLFVLVNYPHIYTHTRIRSGLLTFFSSLVIQESLINFAEIIHSVNDLEFNKSKKSSHCELFFSFCLSACEVELDLAEMACVSSNVRRTFHVPSGVRVQRSISERSVSYPSCFSNPLPQRLRSFSFRGCRRFVVGYLLSRLLVM